MQLIVELTVIVVRNFHASMVKAAVPANIILLTFEDLIYVLKTSLKSF